MPDRIRMIIIGGGVAGYPAAILAARMGAEVTLIERDALGGTCLNRGCIPTKALLQSADVIQTIRNSEVFGIKCKGYDVDFSAVMNRKNAVVSRLTRGVKMLLGAKKVRVVNGTASFVDPRTVRIAETGEMIEGDRILIATGSKPDRIPIEGIDGPDVLDSNQILEMTVLPESVAIIGGGVIGVEFAQFMNAMGVDVTILEMLPSLVPDVDGEIARILEKQMSRSGIKILTGVTVKTILHKGPENMVTYVLEDKTDAVCAGKIFLAVGRSPDFSLLEVDRIGIRTGTRGAIVVNEYMETNVPGIYAAGDVVGGIMLAHLASAEGECAVKNALGFKEAIGYGAVPSCIYTTPEVASVGLTEEKAGESHDIRIGRFPFRANGKAVVLHDVEGMVKIICDGASGKVLGTHIIGPHATDMISEAVLGMTMGMTADDLVRAVHPHPTLSEAVREAAMSLTGGAVHLP